MKAYQEPVTVRTQDGWPATIHWRKLEYAVAAAVTRRDSVLRSALVLAKNIH